jgi:hypothetical protein
LRSRELIFSTSKLLRGELPMAGYSGFQPCQNRFDVAGLQCSTHVARKRYDETAVLSDGVQLVIQHAGEGEQAIALVLESIAHRADAWQIFLFALVQFTSPMKSTNSWPVGRSGAACDKTSRSSRRATCEGHLQAGATVLQSGQTRQVQIRKTILTAPTQVRLSEQTTLAKSLDMSVLHYPGA